MLDYIIIPLTFLVLSIATYADLRTREIPDWLNYGFIIAVLGIRAVYAFNDGMAVVLSGLLGLAAGFSVAAIFYFTNQWGGGDSKLLMGLSAAVGIDLPLQASSLNLLWFLLSLLFLGAAYGLLWMAFLAWRHWPAFREQWALVQKHSRRWQWSTAVATLALAVLAILYPFFWPMVAFPLLVYVLFSFVTAVEKACFYRYQAPKNLVEGDWLAEDIIIRGKTMLTPKTLDKNDLSLLKSGEVEKKVKKVLIKEGIPFTPGFVLAYLTVLGGGWGVKWFLAAVW